jgi:hypothetical protein
MGKLARYTQLLFGSSASNNQISEFGSLAAGSPQRYSGSTITPAIIQTLTNYVQGWFAAAIGPNSPAIEDMNALCYLYAYQLAYLMQEGIAEYDSGTTYYTGSLCSSAGEIYVSLVDNNLNTALISGAHWKVYYGGSRTVSSSSLLTLSDEVVLSNSTSSAIIITLPALSTMPLGKRIIIKDIGNGTYTTTVQGNGSDQIDGNIIYSTSLNQYDSIEVIVGASTTTWYVI